MDVVDSVESLGSFGRRAGVFVSDLCLAGSPDPSQSIQYIFVIQDRIRGLLQQLGAFL